MARFPTPHTLCTHPYHGPNELTRGYRSIQLDYRQTLFLGGGGDNFQLQIQNCVARRSNFHCRDRSLGHSAENLSLQIQSLSLEFQLISITDTDFELKTN